MMMSSAPPAQRLSSHSLTAQPHTACPHRVGRRSYLFSSSLIVLLSGFTLIACHDEEVGGVKLKEGEIRVANYQLASFTYTPRVSAPTANAASTSQTAPQTAPQIAPQTAPQPAQAQATTGSGLRAMTVAAIGKRATREAVANQGQASTAPSAPTQPGVVSGEIRLAPELKVGFPSGATLYIVARAGASARGMPVAVKRINRVSAESFPISYTLTQADSMAGAPLNGAVTISVSVDQDGNAFSKDPGDLKGSLKSPAQVGVNPVHVTLDQRL